MKINSLILGIVVSACLGSTAEATNLVLNGGFEQNSYQPTNTTYSITNPGVPANDRGKITDWIVSGSTPTAFWNAIYIYDNPIAGSSPNPMPAAYRTCDPSFGFQTGAACQNPAGPGYFVNLDGDPGFPTAISQKIIGLEVGKKYELTFSWAAVQRIDATGLTSDEFLEVSLGNLFFTPNIFPGPLSDPKQSLPTHGFSGWFTTTYKFSWDGSSDVLRFLAHGNPGGLPPTVNLDGISLTAVPEPTTWALLIAAGFGLVGVGTRRRRQTAVTD